MLLYPSPSSTRPNLNTEPELRGWEVYNPNNSLLPTFYNLSFSQPEFIFIGQNALLICPKPSFQPPYLPLRFQGTENRRFRQSRHHGNLHLSDLQETPPVGTYLYFCLALDIIGLQLNLFAALVMPTLPRLARTHLSLSRQVLGTRTKGKWGMSGRAVHADMANFGMVYWL